jgi:hypothetical protein
MMRMDSEQQPCLVAFWAELFFCSLVFMELTILSDEKVAWGRKRLVWGGKKFGR